jgi:hypothetical protein
LERRWKRASWLLLRTLPPLLPLHPLDILDSCNNRGIGISCRHSVLRRCSTRSTSLGTWIM